MKRRHLLLVAAALLLSPAALPGRVFAGRAFADGNGKDGGAPKNGDKDAGDKKAGEKKKDERDTPAGKACAAVGADFQAKNAQALVDRVRPKGKLQLSLGSAGDAYAADQAKAVLDAWFKDKKDLKLELTSVDGLTGKFKLTYRKDGTDKPSEQSLYVTVEKKEKGEGFHLAKIEIL
jgi:hypothetical protein